VAVIFLINGGYVTFEEDEVGAVEMAPVQSFTLMERQAIKPNLYLEGNCYHTFNVELVERWSTSLAKIQSVTSADVEMTFYPCYRYQPNRSYSVVLLPDNIIKRYRSGEKEAWVVHSLSLLQSVR
jgi:hypothetical protein